MVSAGCSSSPSTACTASSPMTWGSAKPCRPSPTSPPSTRKRPASPRWSSRPPRSFLTGPPKRRNSPRTSRCSCSTAATAPTTSSGSPRRTWCSPPIRCWSATSTNWRNTSGTSLVLDEAQYIKNPKALTAMAACKLRAAHRLCLSGTPMENHLGELWSLMRFLMPGFLADEKTFNTFIRKPIERDHSGRRPARAQPPRVAAHPAPHQGPGRHRTAGENHPHPRHRPQPETNRPLRIRARRHGRTRARRHRRQGPRQVPHHRARRAAQAPPDLLPPATAQVRGRPTRASTPPSSTISPRNCCPRCSRKAAASCYSRSSPRCSP